jgi:uncharacterized protein (TIGR00645 family)
MHGGAKGSGGPRGRRNGNYKHGRYTAEAKHRRLQLTQWIRNQFHKIDLQQHPDWPQRVSERDFGGLKLKLLGSIVAIAAVEGLEWFLDIEKYSDPSKFVWAIGFQLTFVISLLLLAAAERLTAEKEKA